MVQRVFDRRLLRARRRRAAALGPSTFLVERVAEDLSDRLSAVLRHFACAVDLGTPTDAVRKVLAASGKVGAIIAADVPVSGRSVADGELAVAADEEALPFREASVDLVVSALALQFVNDLPGTLLQVRHALRPYGLLLAALAGGNTLTELRQAFAEACSSCGSVWCSRSRMARRRASLRLPTCATSARCFSAPASRYR